MLNANAAKRGVENPTTTTLRAAHVKRPFESWAERHQLVLASTGSS